MRTILHIVIAISIISIHLVLSGCGKESLDRYEPPSRSSYGDEDPFWGFVKLSMNNFVWYGQAVAIYNHTRRYSHFNMSAAAKERPTLVYDIFTISNIPLQKGIYTFETSNEDLFEEDVKLVNYSFANKRHITEFFICQDCPDTLNQITVEDFNVDNGEVRGKINVLLLRNRNVLQKIFRDTPDTLQITGEFLAKIMW